MGVYAIWFIVVMAHPTLPSQTVWKIEGENFTSITACEISQKNYRIKANFERALLPSWEQEEPEGSFCCIKQHSGSICKTVGRLVANNRS